MIVLNIEVHGTHVRVGVEVVLSVHCNFYLRDLVPQFGKGND